MHPVGNVGCVPLKVTAVPPGTDGAVGLVRDLSATARAFAATTPAFPARGSALETFLTGPEMPEHGCEGAEPL